MRAVHRVLAGPVAAIFLYAIVYPTVLFAQWDDDDGFDFGEDEVESWDDWDDDVWDDWDDDGWDTDDGWGDDGWGDEPAVTPEVTPTGPRTVTGLFVPGSVISPQVADQLTDILLRRLGDLEGHAMVSNEPLRDEFEIMGAELAFECAFDPVCLGRYGRTIGYDKIVIARVEQTPSGQWSVTIDLVDVNASSVENYRVFATDARVASVDDALEGQLRALFGLRRLTGPVTERRTGPSPVQRGLAWTTLGLSVAALGTGIAFGTQVNSINKELEDCPLSTTTDGRSVCTTPMRDARDRYDEARGASTLSTVFIGTGLFLGVASVILFTVTPGGDIDESHGLASSPRDFNIAPAVSNRGFGLSGGFRF